MDSYQHLKNSKRNLHHVVLNMHRYSVKSGRVRFTSEFNANHLAQQKEGIKFVRLKGSTN